MSIKLLLAEALEILTKAEEAENAADRLQLATAKGQTRTRDFLAVKRQYSAAYDMYIRGLELLNYCRRQGIDNKIAELQQFCTTRMTTYMNRCDQLREKETNILMTVDQADSSSCLDKEGFAVGQIVFMKHAEIKQNTPIRFEATLTDGAYQLIVKNYDAPGMAQPEVNALIALQGVTGKNLRFTKLVGPRCAWSRYVGVLTSATVHLTVTTDAWVRSSKVEVILRALIPVEPEAPNVVAGPIPGGWIDSLPELPPPTAALDLPVIPSFDPNKPNQQPPPPPGGYSQQSPPPGYQQPGPGYPMPPSSSDNATPVVPPGGYGENHADPMAGVAPPPQQSAVQRPTVTVGPAPPAQQTGAQQHPRDAAPTTAVQPKPQAAPVKAQPFRTNIPVPESDDDRALEPEVLALRIAQLRDVMSTYIKPTVPRMPAGTKLNGGESALVAAVKGFPEPTPLLGEDCGNDMDFNVNAADLE